MRGIGDKRRTDFDVVTEQPYLKPEKCTSGETPQSNQEDTATEHPSPPPETSPL